MTDILHPGHPAPDNKGLRTIYDWAATEVAGKKGVTVRELKTDYIAESSRHSPSPMMVSSFEIQKGTRKIFIVRNHKHQIFLVNYSDNIANSEHMHSRIKREELASIALSKAPAPVETVQAFFQSLNFNDQWRTEDTSDVQMIIEDCLNQPAPWRTKALAFGFRP